MAAIALSAFVPCQADSLLGSQVTAILQLNSPTGLNWFTTPTGQLNSGANTFDANISPINDVSAVFNLGTGGDFLTLNLMLYAGQAGRDWYVTLKDAAFTNFNPTVISNALGAAFTRIAPDTLQFQLGPIPSPGGNATYSATYELVDPPSLAEPPDTLSWLIAGTGLTLLALSRRRVSCKP